MTLLASRSVSASIGSRQICTGLDYQLQSGECWGLLGPNGIGKTTLLHIFAGLREPDSGNILIYDKKLTEYSKKNLARKAGILFQDSEDTFPATVIETVLTGRHPHLPFWSFESGDDIRISFDILNLVSLAEMAHRQVNTLSGGERRRLAIATLMVQDPDIWLLDEPTNHLDLRHQIILLKMMIDYAMNKHRGVLMVLHDVNLVLRFCTHAMLMIDYQKIICGPVSEVITLDNLQSLYQHGFRRVKDEGIDFFHPV